MWFYISTYIVLLGAELNAEMEHQTARDTTVGPREPMGMRRAHMADTLGESPSAGDSDGGQAEPEAAHRLVVGGLAPVGVGVDEGRVLERIGQDDLSRCALDVAGFGQ